jgi:hypothetical protein
MSPSVARLTRLAVVDGGVRVRNGNNGLNDGNRRRRACA